MFLLSQKLDKNGGFVSDVKMMALLAALGEIEGVVSIGKFGYSQNVDNGVATDLHDGANATNDQDLIVAPTAARVHAIVSSSASDAAAGVGARTMRVYGLTAWDAKETSEVVTLNGTTPVNTANAYVFINRMVVLTKGATSVNVGNITATAATDGTVSTRILAGNGQTEFGALAVPSVQRVVLLRIYASVMRSSPSAAAVDLTLKLNPTPTAELLNFLTIHRFALDSDATSRDSVTYESPRVYDGGCIIKLQASATADNTFVSGGFDVLLIDV